MPYRAAKFYFHVAIMARIDMCVALFSYIAES
uniref:Uncharacterized protein n=1 Tax=Anguilla anguilla TaxID=7936 RepID=A0A0E9U9B4_ANGAN